MTDTDTQADRFEQMMWQAVVWGTVSFCTRNK